MEHFGVRIMSRFWAAVATFSPSDMSGDRVNESLRGARLRCNRMRHFSVCVLLALLLAACSESTAGSSARQARAMPVSSAELAACGVDSEHRSRLMALSPNEFDQDLTGGWRPVADRAGCELAAATLLKDYIDENGIEPDDGAMHWHVGQMLAFAGSDEAAIPWLEMTPQTEPALQLYVEGTVAFLARDRVALQNAIDSLSAVKVSVAEREMKRQFLEDNPDISVPEGFLDEPPNLRVLEGLLGCFEDPYSVAYGCEA